MMAAITTMPAAAVSLDCITITRGGVEIISDLSLNVASGSVYGLVGPSGSGKTTLIRGLLGLSPITGGSANVLGTSPGTVELRSRIGYMPQDAAIYPDLSCRENLSFFAAIYRVDDTRIQELIDLLDLAAVADRPVQTYSGGQKQRVALAAALVPAPELLLLDEPTVGLDPRLRARLWDAFRSFAAGGTTLLVSTHVMDEALKCDQIAFLAEGQLVADGTPEDLMAQADANDLESAVLALTDPASFKPRREERHVG